MKIKYCSKKNIYWFFLIFRVIKYVIVIDDFLDDYLKLCCSVKYKILI